MVTCPSCGQPNPEGARFCNACASELAVAAQFGREERKVVTVLFADLVGFTARAERLDPEDVRALLAPYHERLRGELEHFGGTVEKFIGDAVMALFGAPVAHEDDPERAVRAAMSIRDRLIEEGEDLRVRIGVNTGEALVALDARASSGEAMAAGDVVNTAARIQAGAPVNAVLVGAQTYRASAHVIEYREAEPVIGKGKSEPIAVWEAVGARSRLGVDVVQRPAAPLVGRRRELELVASALARVREERSPQLVTLVGVPGIGKSRLVYELAQRLEQEPELITWRQGRSLPYGEGVTFWALGEIVKAQAGILESDSAEQAEAKLRDAVAELAADDAELQWLHGHLVALAGAGAEDAGAAAGEPFAAWRRFLEALAEARPLALVFEDLHWADDALLDFIDELVERVSDVPLFVLATSRPELLERRAGWGGGKPNAVTLSLPPLSDDASAQLVAALLQRPVLEAGEQQALLARVGGNPLYAEQYARALTERGDLGELPETVQGIIAARLDVLSHDEKRLLQDAAVVGKVFWVGVLGAIGDTARSDAEDVLRRLERKQFVQRARRASVAGESEYAFRHVLLRDVAYGQIPRGARADKHRRAAEWLESLGRAEDHAELLADHYANALEYAKASGGADDELVDATRAALRDAGDRAAALAAYASAVRFYEAALALAPADPVLLLRLGRTRFAAESAGTDELEAAFHAFAEAGDNEDAAEAALELRGIAWYEGDRDRAERWLERAIALVRDRPDSEAKAKVLVDRGRMLHVAGEYEEAIRVGREALPVVERLGLQRLRAQVLYSLGTSRGSLGDRAGLADLEQAVTVAREANAVEQFHAALNNLSEIQFLFGEVAAAAKTYASLRESVERFGRDTDRRWARVYAAAFRFNEGRWDEALELFDRFIAEAEAGAPHYLEPTARFLRASIRLARGDVAGADDDSERALDSGRLAKDAQVFAPALQTRATLLLERGLREPASRVLDELFALGPKVAPALISALSTAVIDFAWLSRRLGREREVLGLLVDAPELPWVVAARAVAVGDWDGGIAILAEIEAPCAEAHARLRAGEELVAAGRPDEAESHLERALAFYRRAGGPYFVEKAEALRAASAERDVSTG